MGSWERILVVDDLLVNCQLLEEILQSDGYLVKTATSGAEALRIAELITPDLVLLDINMPGMSGFDLCEQLQKMQRTRGVPVIFISALAEVMDKVKAFEIGGVDYITKPFQVNEVRARVSAHLKIYRLTIQLERHNSDLESLVREKMQEISESQLATIFALARLAESRDNETGKHIERIQVFCRMIAEVLARREEYANIINRTFIDNMYYASPMHDIGKVAIPDAILNKPGSLTNEEFEIMKTHTTLGADTLMDVVQRYPNNSFLNMGIEIANYHHEHWNGNGYPKGLRDIEIPLPARIMAIVDVYDALRSKRCYKEAYGHKFSMDLISENSGVIFDPDVVEVFMELEEEICRIRDRMDG